jgi:hypothetical protein
MDEIGGTAAGLAEGLGDVGGQMRAEWTAEQEAAAADAAAQWRHTRTLADWLTERMHAGDRIAVTIGETRFAGVVVESGDDLIALQGVFGRVDIHVAHGIPIFIELVDRVAEGGQRATASRSFHDALIARDGRDDLSIGTLHDPQGLDGTLFVGKDFVSMVTKLGVETVVPMQFVTWVAPRRM